MTTSVCGRSTRLNCSTTSAQPPVRTKMAVCSESERARDVRRCRLYVDCVHVGNVLRAPRDMPIPVPVTARTWRRCHRCVLGACLRAATAERTISRDECILPPQRLGSISGAIAHSNSDLSPGWPGVRIAQRGHARHAGARPIGPAWSAPPCAPGTRTALRNAASAHDAGTCRSAGGPSDGRGESCPGPVRPIASQLHPTIQFRLKGDQAIQSPLCSTQRLHQRPRTSNLTQQIHISHRKPPVTLKPALPRMRHERGSRYSSIRRISGRHPAPTERLMELTGSCSRYSRSVRTRRSR